MAWRLYFVLSMIYLAAFGLVWRVYDLSVLDQPFLRKQGDGRVLRLVDMPTVRGMIVDRNGFPLAVSATVYSVWINPFEFSPTKSELFSLSQILHVKQQTLAALMKRGERADREFVYLQRGLPPHIANAVNGLHLPGLYTQVEYHRYYPEGESTAQLVGITDIDDHGKEGLELAYNQWLQGVRGQQLVIKDRLGRTIDQLKIVKEQEPGHHLVLSIDRRIQYLAYRELLNSVTVNKATSGSAIVLDVKTGEVLAMANLPSFNPNQRFQRGNHGDLRNRAVTDMFEPGSTIKIFSIGGALEKGEVKPDTMLNTYPGWMRVGHNLIKDVHSKGPMTVTQVLQRSSNVGVSKIVLGLPTGYLEGFLRRVGFGEATGITFPGEQSGVLSSDHHTGTFTLATLAFGYGLSATPLQLARAYLVIANDGKKIPITLLKQDEIPQNERAMDPKLAKSLVTMLQSVLQKEGTGYLANVPDYCVAGKTGTSVKVGAHGGYEKHHYISSFIGMAPCDHPRFVVVVFINDPLGKAYYGGVVSGPVFSKIMEGSLRILNVS